MRLYNQYTDHMLFDQHYNFLIKGENSNGDIKSYIKNNKTGKTYYPLSVSKSDSEFIVEYHKIKGSFDDYTLIVSDDIDEITLNDIHFGDLYLYMGQSNMSYELKNDMNRKKYAELTAKYDIYGLNILEADVTKEGYINRPLYPMKEISSKFRWMKLNNENAMDVSILAVMTSVMLSENKNYPIGFMTAAIGGISIDAFLPYEVVESNKKIKNYLLKTGKYIHDPKENYNSFKEVNFQQSYGMYNEKINPIKDFKVSSFIWYQGENSAIDYRSGLYFKEALTTLIKLYRKIFHERNAQFILTAIAPEYYPYGDTYGYMYINESLSHIKLNNTVYIPTYDIENPWMLKCDNLLHYHPIHPVNKEKISMRYALSIKDNNLFYPYVKSVRRENNKLVLTIGYYGKGLKPDSSYQGFSVAGKDNKYYLAEARSINESEIELYSEFVKEPFYYSYALDQYPLYDDCKTMDNMPLIESRSRTEDYKNGVYLFNAALYNTETLSLRENNFGTSNGGGFDIPLFENGSIIRSAVKIEKSDNGIMLYANPEKDSYYYFSVKVNCSLSGLHSNLDKFKYMRLSFNSDSDLEIDGLLYRTYKGTMKLSLINYKGPVMSIHLKEGHHYCYIDLSKYYDGADGLYMYNQSKEALKNIMDFEIMMRAYHSVRVELLRIDLTDEIIDDIHYNE